MATELYRTFNAAVRKVIPSKPIYSRSCVYARVPQIVAARRLVLGFTSSGLGVNNVTGNLLKLPWSSLIRSLYKVYSNANLAPRVRQSPSFWTPSFRYNKQGFKTWPWATLPPLLLTFPLVHCEGQPGPRPKPSTACGCDIRFDTPCCGPSCDRHLRELQESQSQPPAPPPPVIPDQNSAKPVEVIPPTTITLPPSNPPAIIPAPPPVATQSPPPPPCPPLTPPTTNKYCMSPVIWCETSELSHEFLVRQAVQLAVDSVTRIMCETIAAYQDYHEKYRCLLDSLIDSLENSRHSDGVQLELLDCRIIILRAEVENMKGRILELEAFMGSVQRLSEAAAETAFLGGAEYHSLAMSERLASVIREMNAIKEESCRKERDMIEIQSVVIIEAGKGLK